MGSNLGGSTPTEAPKGKVRRAHMVSEGYLKAWGNARGIIDVIDMQLDIGYATSTKNATVVSYVYDPAVMSHDLEAEYAGIENAGIAAIDRLRRGEQELSIADQEALIAFLDMHHTRGRYADRAGALVPAMLVNSDGTVESADLRLGDMLILSRGMPDTKNLRELGLENWPWSVHSQEISLATGDGAVMQWAASEAAAVSAVTFPLSPSQLLVIGEEFPDDVPLNPMMAKRSARWLVGARGTLNLNWKKPEH